MNNLNAMIMKCTKPTLRKVGFILSLGLLLTSCQKDHHYEPLPGEQAEYHQTAVTHFAKAGDVQYAYRTLGNQAGVPLIMISPLGGSMDDWDPAVTDGLAQQNKVIIFDIEGVASSTGKTPDNIPAMAKGIVNFIRALGLNKVNLMGFSMGSFIAQQIVLTEPGLVNKLVLTGTGPKGSQGLSELPKVLASTAGLSPEEGFLKIGFTSSAASIAAGKASYQRTQRRQVNRDPQLSLESSQAEVTAVLGWAQPYPDALLELSKVTQPVFIAQGENDIPVPLINAVNLSKSFPNARLETYADSGHAGFFQNYTMFVASVNGFLKN
jgi:pimeloyl-ACP methyl ester carboxylesterase